MSSMIFSVREAAGLGCPPAKYTTNRNESLNKVAKAQANFSRMSCIGGRTGGGGGGGGGMCPHKILPACDSIQAAWFRCP